MTIEDVNDRSDAAMQGYDAALAAQVAAVFLIREGGSMDKLKLVKLMYLAERGSVEHHGRPMFFDENFSLEHGPAGTNTIDGLNGLSDTQIWDRYLTTDGNTVRVRETLVEQDFDDLCDAHLKIVEHIAAKFKGDSASAVRAWTHRPENVPEYQETKSSRIPITDAALAQHLGMRDPEGYAAAVHTMRGMERGRIR